MTKKFIAELFGTMWLVLGGCGTAVLATNSTLFPELNVGFVGVALAFGLSVLTMAHAIGHISGAHLNPAVTLGLWAGKRHPTKEVVPYIIAQIIGAIIGAVLIYLIASGREGFEAGGFAANGYGEYSPGGYGLVAALICEIVMTFFFLFIILGSTYSKAPKGLAGVAIGLALTLIHLISIPVTNTSVNPARSISQALFAEGNWAIPQLWLFIVGPIVGALLAGFVYNALSPEVD